VLLLIVGTAIAGVCAIRRHGLPTAVRLSQAIERGESPGSAMVDHALVVMAGMLLVAPGVLTDVLGGLLLVPPLRRLVAFWGLGLLRPQTWDDQRRPPGDGHGGQVIDGEFERVDERDTSPRRPPSPPHIS
jgi:UPF0716 protein FxsA